MNYKQEVLKMFPNVLVINESTHFTTPNSIYIDYGYKVSSKFDLEDLAWKDFYQKFCAKENNLILTDEVKLIFENDNGLSASITITVETLLEYNQDDFYEMLEETIPCSCTNESQSFCECNTNFEDYNIVRIEPITAR